MTDGQFLYGRFVMFGLPVNFLV